MRYWSILLVLLIVVFSPATAQIVDSGIQVSETLPGFRHTIWLPKDGVAAPIRFITQTPDGFLWIGGEELQRFDGKTFETIPAPAGVGGAKPRTGLVDNQGYLWVGYSEGGFVATFRNGRLEAMTIPGAKDGQVFLLSKTSDGAIWAWCGYGQLHRYFHGKWTWMDKALGLPNWSLMGMEGTADGALWIATSDGKGRGALRRLAPGGREFVLQPDRIARTRMTKVQDGSLWISDNYGARQIRDGRGGAPTTRRAFAVSADATMPLVTVDRKGGVWQTTGGEGLLYQGAEPGAIPLLLRSAGAISSEATTSAFVDREGSTWVGTIRGLDQFVPVPISREAAVPADFNNGVYISRSDDGSIYLLARKSLYVLRSGSGSVVPILSGIDGIRNLCPAYGGGVWLQRGGRVQLIGSRRKANMGVPGGPRAVECAEDKDGRLWSRGVDATLWHDAKGWHQAPRTLTKALLVTGPDGNAVFGGRDGSVYRIEGTSIRTFPRTAVGVGSIAKIVAIKDAVLISGARGTARLVGNTITRASEAQFGDATLWMGLVRDRGTTWLQSGKGLFGVRNQDFDRVFTDKHATLAYDKFSERHGYDAVPQNIGRSGPQMAIDPGGRVWFLTAAGPMVLTPDRVKPNSKPPIVRITSIAAGSRFWRDPAPVLGLPKGGNKLQITFAANSLVSPEDNRIWYQLTGQDAGWVDAAGAREATYTNLRPGTYVFRVKAVNADGALSTSVASVELRQPPRLTQSLPFKLLCAALVLALLWVTYLIRLRIVSSRIHNKLVDRLQERERVARDIHDTLLQSVQALMLHFQIALNKLPEGEQARGDLARVMDRAERGIAEGRDRLRNLRRPDHPHDLEEAVAAIALDQLAGTGIALDISVEGKVRAVAPLAWAELADVLAELFSNIARHSGARLATVQIQYNQVGLVLTVSDDGKGIDPTVAVEGRPGHFGLQGMRERILALRGRIAIAARDGGGTEATVNIPSRAIYADSVSDRRAVFRWWR